MKSKHYFKSVLSMLIAVIMIIGMLPTLSFAAQSNEYVDPADVWLSANGRTNELDMNATITYETSYCTVCDMHTTVMTYRVPEYTRSGETALNRDIKYSDGTKIDGKSTGNLDDGIPGVDAFYTGCHWTKSVCQVCGTINCVNGYTEHDFNNNVYSLNKCDHNFYLNFDNTSYEKYNNVYHDTTIKKGQFCQFCKGTYARATEKREPHNFEEIVDGQIGNNRFYIHETCKDCGFETSEYVAAKSVVSSYYGTVDGDPHTLTVSDLSDNGVNTSIRYGTSADNCNKTSAPNYTEAGYYPIYYKINYTYGDELITENGVSYVWLLEKDKDDIIIIQPMPENKPHTHNYTYLETVMPSCNELGYDRFQCTGENGCGHLQKTNYTPMTGHNYQVTTIREATCTQQGLKLHICTKCGDFYEEITPLANHSYSSRTYNPTCSTVGYTEHTCKYCGDEYITDMTPLVSHAYERIVKAPTCVDKGYTTHICTTCNFTLVTDYTEPTGHAWDEGTEVTSSTCVSEGVVEYHCKNCDEKMIKSSDATGHTPGDEATCTEPQICTVCKAILEIPKGHKYNAEVTEPTCTKHGYTTYTCDCGDSYVSDITEMAEHNYSSKVTDATCTEYGYTTHTCECGAEYVSDYTNKLPHDYETVVTPPTCTKMGFTTYTCKDCGDTYVGDYTEIAEHNYNKEVVEPTCTEHGYAVYKCPDCGKEYIGDYTDEKEHHYTETVVAPTCTEMGYTIYTCTDCDDSYKGNYTDKLPHDCEAVVTEPTCTSHGFTTYSCKNCDYENIADYTEKTNHIFAEEVTAPTCLTLGYTTYTCQCGETYKSNYVEALGHTPTDWIIDTPATIDGPGEKHIECMTCGEVLKTTDIPQLVAADRTDEDGYAVVGDYTIIITDEKNIPVFNSEISIDADDNVTVKLPSGRLLDFNDRTIIKAIKTENKIAAESLSIYISDINNNKATGKTNAEGILVVPNSQSSTTDDNGTIGKEEEDAKKTFVITVTDKSNVVIDNCDVYLGESNNVVVDLPDGIKPTSEYPVIIKITDQNGNAQTGVTVITLGDSDYIEKGVTDMFGKITLPTAYEGYTDVDGKVNIMEYYIFVADETKEIENAFVKQNDDKSISVILPEGTLIDYANRITVTVMTKKGEAVSYIIVSVSDETEKEISDITNDKGQMVVPPLHEDYTDAEGKAKVSGYDIIVADETAPIENAYIMFDKENTEIVVVLPQYKLIAYDNRVAVTVSKDTEAIRGMKVVVKDSTEKSEFDITNANGVATVPPINIDYTDHNGDAQVNNYIVKVVNEQGAIENAYLELTVTTTEPEGEGEPVVTENLAITLPENVKFEYSNRITVTVLNKADKTPVKDLTVAVTEFKDGEEEPKKLEDKTDKNGIVVFPNLSEDITNDKGDSGVTETTPGKGEDTDGDGKEDKPGEDVTTAYNVSVKDTKGVITNALVKVNDGKVFVTLPDTYTLTASNQTTVTVTDKDGKGVKDVSVTVTDKNNQTATKTTDVNGQVVVPNKPSSGGGSSSRGSRSGGGGGGSYISTNTTNVTVTDKDGKAVNVSKSTDSKGNVTITLPTGKTLDNGNWYTIKTKDRNGKVKADVEVTLKDKNKNESKGVTDKNGILVLPAVEHTAYIVGYNDGTFRADSDMTRAEAAAIFARLIAEDKDEDIRGTSKFSDVNSKDWYADYVGYLAKYNIIKGYTDNTFKPDDGVTRAEFVAMAVRYYDLDNEVKKCGYTVKYTDISAKYWAYDDIAFAKNIGWLNGYADGTFKGDNNITRAEVVTVVNRATGRIADKEFVNANLTKLNQFTDLKNNSHWAFYDCIESSNTHKANTNGDSENWVK